MNRKYQMICLILIGVLIILNIGCSDNSSESNKIAFVSANVNSEYEKTFKELQLGILFDFDLRITNADKSWVNIWVEGYRNGKPVEPFPLTQLSYGLSPKKIEEGQMGFGIINPNSNEPLLFLYSTDVRTGPHIMENNFFIKNSISSWDYAIGSEEVELDYGEEVVLAVYRQGKESLRSGYDYQKLESINKMIQEDITVLLLKIKVEKRTKL